MQFNQPTGFQTTGFTNYAQLYGFNIAPPFQFNGYPEIIGEGDVTSIISPDGSTQFVFMPTAYWWRSRPQNINTGNFNNPYSNNLEAWFVRSIYNPVQPTVFSQPYQIPFGFEYPNASTSNCGLNLPAPDVPLKFHNHNCTSTSDINYFMPKQRNWFDVSAGVQVDIPFEGNTDSPYKAICTKPCNCTPYASCSNAKKKQNNQCMCANSSNSEMSVEESKPDLNNQKSGNNKMSRKFKRSKNKKASFSVKCECFTQTASDKCVTTYSDQATGNVSKTGQKTKTACNSSNSDLCESGSCICSSGTELDS